MRARKKSFAGAGNLLPTVDYRHNAVVEILLISIGAVGHAGCVASVQSG
jgi:hypothetical protein